MRTSGVRPASRGRTWKRTRQPGPSGPSAPTHTCGSSFPSSTRGSSIPAGLGRGLEKFWGQQRCSGLPFLPPGPLLPPRVAPLPAAALPAATPVAYLQQQELLQWLIPLQQEQAGGQGGQQEGAARVGVPHCKRGRRWGPGRGCDLRPSQPPKAWLLPTRHCRQPLVSGILVDRAKRLQGVTTRAWVMGAIQGQGPPEP